MCIKATFYATQVFTVTHLRGFTLEWPLEIDKLRE